jgi:hypothetical protein
MLLKAVGQPLGIAKRVQESQWEMPKAYWKASGQFLKDLGKPLGNAQIPLPANRRGGRIAMQLSAKHCIHFL